MIINQKTKLLVISPHPDDEALGCGGLIGKCLKEKASVCIVYVSVGDNRQLITSYTKAKLRLKEVDAVKNLTKAQIIIYYKDKEFFKLETRPQKYLIDKLEETINSFAPSIIAIPSSASYNQDHRYVFDACISALRPVPKTIRHFVPNILEYFEPYFWSARSQKQPNVYLDLTERFKNGNLLDFRLALYACHKTQVRQDPFPRSPENLIHIAHTYGKEIGVDIAEAYHLIREEIC